MLYVLNLRYCSLSMMVVLEKMAGWPWLSDSIRRTESLSIHIYLNSAAYALRRVLACRSGVLTVTVGMRTSVRVSEGISVRRLKPRA